MQERERGRGREVGLPLEKVEERRRTGVGGGGKGGGGREKKRKDFQSSFPPKMNSYFISSLMRRLYIVPPFLCLSLPLYLSLSPSFSSPPCVLSCSPWIWFCSSLFSRPSRKWVIHRLCGSILKNMKKKTHLCAHTHTLLTHTQALRKQSQAFYKWPAYQIKLS